MNTLLTKHVVVETDKTREESVAAYIKAWENSRYLLGPVAKMIQERLQVLDNTKETDFDTPNHYAKLMFQHGKKEELKLLLSMLPKGLDK